jgi:small nuclear ribonucleoprotein (snRNP)-like protein
MALEQANKVVVACLDGRRLKGRIYDFSALKDHFRLFPEGDSRQQQGTDLAFKDVKAIFFVKDFAGHSGHHDLNDLNPARGRPMEVTFQDGEKIVGTTEAFNPQRTGFFVFPVDPDSNNIRIFVVTKNAREVKRL